MSVEDGLVMQLHVGSFRNHNQLIFDRFGRDMGADIPVATEFTRNLRPLLNRYGNDPRLPADPLHPGRDDLWPRAGAAGRPLSRASSWGRPGGSTTASNGMRRYFDRVMETAGIYNTAGFNDDTRAFPSIPARHDVWRRAAANWLAGLVVRHMVDEDDAAEMAQEMAYGLAKRAYNL